MSSFPILDLVIGMIFIYFLLSIISSSMIEIIITGLRARARLLEEWLYKIFDKTVVQPDGKKISLGQAIMDHCTVTGLSRRGRSPSYIDAKNFTSALLEKITFDPANPTSIARDLDEIIASLEKTTVLSTEFQRVALTYAIEARETYRSLSEKTVSEIDLFRGKLENWYDSSMDRVTDALKKRYSRPATFLVALVVSSLLNADSIAIARYLYSNPETRTKLTMQAYDAVKDTALINQVKQLKTTGPFNSPAAANLEQIKVNIIKKISAIDRAKESLDDAIPLTWKGRELVGEHGRFSLLLLLSKITGIAATILAIMMGAPFWFDTLNRISNVRSAGAKPPVSSSEEEKIRN